MIVTRPYRIKDSSSRELLNKMAGSVNFMWNYCNDISSRSIQERGVFLSNFDLDSLLSGSSKLYERKRREFSKSSKS